MGTWVIFFIILFLASCGGTGGSGSDSKPSNSVATCSSLSSISNSFNNVNSSAIKSSSSLSVSSFSAFSWSNISTASSSQMSVSSSATSSSQAAVASSASNTSAPSTTFDAIKQAYHRRVDFLLIGDSNALLGGSGWDHGYQYALSKEFGEYATGVISARENDGNGEGVGYFFNYLWYEPELTSPSTPTFYSQYMDGLLQPQALAYADKNITERAIGMILQKNGPLNLNNALRFHFCYGTFAHNGGTTDAGVRQEEPPYSLLNSQKINSTTGVDGIGFTTIDLLSGARNTDIGVSFVRQGGQMGSPFVSYYLRAENSSMHKGISFTTLYGVGGTSLYDMADSFINTSDKTLKLQLYEARRLQEADGQEPVVVMVVSAGLNDRHETSQPSLGKHPSQSPESAEAYIDNLDALINRVESVWSQHFSNGYLFWLIVPSQPVSVPDDPKLLSYRAAAKTYAAHHPNTAIIDVEELIGGQKFIDSGWYNANGTDTAHLTQNAYESISDTIIKKIIE